MAINIPMNELLKVVDNRDPNDSKDLNGFEAEGAIWRKPYTLTIPAKPAGITAFTVSCTNRESNCEQAATSIVSNLKETGPVTGTVLFGDTLSVTSFLTPGYEYKAGVTQFTFSGIQLDSNNKVIGCTNEDNTGSISITAPTRKKYKVYYSAMPVGVSQFEIHIADDFIYDTRLVSNPISAGYIEVVHGTKLYAIITRESGFEYPTIAGISTDPDNPTTVTSDIGTSTNAPGIVVTRGAPKAYTLTISTIEGVASQAVSRTSSPYKGATTGGLSNGATIYYGDELTITATADTGYDAPTVPSTTVYVTGPVDTANYITAGDYKTYTITISYISDYGTVRYGNIIKTEIKVKHGTVLYAPDNRLGTWGITLNDPSGQGQALPAFIESCRAEENTDTAQYDYGFSGWYVNNTKLGATLLTGTTIKGPMTFEARFTRDIQTYTVSFTNPTYGKWNSSSLTLPYGTTWSVSNNVITFTTPNNGGAVTNTVKPGTPTAHTLSFAADANGRGSWNDTATVDVYDYIYTSPIINGSATGTITGTKTFTASDSQSANTITNSLSTTPTNGSTSGNHVWTISGVDSSGASFTRKFTSTAHSAGYYYIISRNLEGTNILADATFKPSVAAYVHTYPITITNSSYGVVKKADGTAISSNTFVDYNTVLTVVPNSATAQYTYDVSTSTGSFVTTNGNKTLTVNGAETITFSRVVRNYTVTIASNNSTWGTVSPAKIENVPYGTEVYTNREFVYVGNTQVTPTPAAQTDKYTYGVGTWSNASGTITGNRTITANFTRTTRKYTITIINPTYGKVCLPNGTEIANGAKIDYDTQLTIHQTSITGYTSTVKTPIFPNGTTGTTGFTVKGNSTVEFIRTPNTYTITYYNTAGQVWQTDSRVYPAAATIRTNSFPKGQETMYDYTVTYNYNNGTGSPASAQAKRVKSYSANGWITADGTHFQDGESFSSAMNLTLQPAFTSTTSGGSVTLPSATRTGYTFVTWDDGGMEGAGGAGDSYTPRSDVTLTADWKANKYTVKFYGNGATSGSMSDQSFTYDKAQNLTAEAFGRAYTVTYNYGWLGQINTTATATSDFNGWATRAAGDKVYDDKQSVSNLTSTNNGTVNLYANWTLGTVRLPRPDDRTGYTCDGWYTAASGGTKVGDIGDSYTPLGNITLYAQWTPNTYWVYYRNISDWATGGTLPSDQSRTYPNATTLATNNMTKSPTTDATYTVTFNYNGSGAANTTATANKTTTYYANGWTTTEKSTTQTHANGASFGANSTTNLRLYPCFTQSTSTSAVTLPTPTRTGYTFLGWATSSTATSGTTGTYTPTSDVTLYAIWAEGVGVGITFKALSGMTTSYTKDPGTGLYIHAASTTQTYTGYGTYTKCVIDGITVGSSWTRIKTGGGAFGSWKYTARFADGNLTLRTEYSKTTSSATAVSASVSAYTTTAIFSGTVEYTVTLPEPVNGIEEIEYEITYPDDNIDYVSRYQGDGDTTVSVPYGTIIDTFITCVTGIDVDRNDGPWTITSDTTIPVPSLRFNDTPNLVSTSSTSSSITIEYENTTDVNVNIIPSIEGNHEQIQADSYPIDIAPGDNGLVVATGLNANTKYDVEARYVDPAGKIGYGPDIIMSVTTAKEVPMVWQTVCSGSSATTITFSSTIPSTTGTLNIPAYTGWWTNATKVRITGTVGMKAVFGQTTFEEVADVSFNNSNNSYSFSTTVSHSETSLNGTVSSCHINLTNLRQSGISYTATKLGMTSTKVTITKVELYVPEPTKLSAPDIYIDQSVPDELYLEVSNNNDTTVTFYVTVYDNQDMAFGSESMTIAAGMVDKPLYISLSSSVESGYIEAYFTADGYLDSEILVQDW